MKVRCDAEEFRGGRAGAVLRRGAEDEVDEGGDLPEASVGDVLTGEEKVRRIESGKA